MVRGFDDWLDNHGNPGIEDTEGDEMDTEDAEMVPVFLDREEITEVMAMMREYAWQFAVAYDPVERKIKFKVNGGSWSPGMGRVMEY